MNQSNQVPPPVAAAGGVPADVQLKLALGTLGVLLRTEWFSNNHLAIADVRRQLVDLVALRFEVQIEKMRRAMMAPDQVIRPPFSDEETLKRVNAILAQEEAEQQAILEMPDAGKEH